MDLELSPEALEATFSELTHLLIVPDRLIVERVQLGAGGFGVVYLATLDTLSKHPRRVAVKQLRIVQASVGTPRIAFRLARELKVWAKVKHPNILELIGYYISENYVEAQLVSAFMVNGNVMQYIKRSHVSAVTRLKFVRDIASGLKYLHEFSPPICHGDLKPANVLVNESIDAVLSDFGVSSFISESGAPSGLTTSKSTKGALRYMSPELILQDQSKHSIQSDVWAWGCTAFEVGGAWERKEGCSKDPAIILEVLNKSAPGLIDALNTVILGTDVDLACHTGVSSLRSLIPQCWDFDPTQRPPASRILQCITMPSKAEAPLGAWEDQEEGISSLHFGDNSGHGGGTSHEQIRIAPHQAHALCINCQQYPKVGGQDFCSKACLDDASSRLAASAENKASSQRFTVPNFSNLSSSFSPKLKTPQSMRAGFNPSTGEFTGLSKKREPISQETAIASQDREKNPQAVAEISEFHQETAGAPGKSADKVMATSPTTSGNYDLGEGLLNTSQAKHAGANQATPSREKPKQNGDSDARTSPFNTLSQRAPEDPQSFSHQHQPSIFKKLLSVLRFRLPKTSSQAPFPHLPSAQYRRKSGSATTGDDEPTEQKTATNAAIPETKTSTASDVQVSLPTGTDITQFESSGRAAGWGETMSIQPPAPRRPKRRSTHKPRPHTYVGGDNPPKIPGQPPIPPLPTARSRRGSASTQHDEAPKSHRRSSSVKQSAPDIRSPLEIDELQGLSSASGKRSERVKAWDRSGQITERTKPKFTGGFSDVSQAKLGDRVVAVKALRVGNIEGGEGRIWKRLAREIYVWAALDHPNVLELLGFAIEDGIPCLISPWCDNGTLQEYLQKFPDANRRRLVREIAEGLKYLHLQTPPIIHGNLKTANVFVTADYEAKISDYGGSRRAEQLRTGFTTAGLVLTTIRYSAPEILRDGQHPTLCSDVFSFAYIVLETMTDKYPFWKTPKPLEVISQVVFKKQTPSPEDHPGMEDAIWELLRRCWNYEPSDRPHMVDVCKMLSAAGYGSSTGHYLPTLAGPATTSYSQLGRSTSSVYAGAAAGNY